MLYVESGKRAIMILFIFLTVMILSIISPVFPENAHLPLKGLWKTSLDSNVRQIEILKNGKGFTAVLKGKQKKRWGPHLEGSLLSLDPQSGKVKWKYVPKYIMSDVQIASDEEYLLSGETIGEFVCDILYFNKFGDLLWKKRGWYDDYDMSEDGKLILLSPGANYEYGKEN